MISTVFNSAHYRAILSQLRAQGRPITLVAVSKYAPIADIVSAYHAGQRDFGESRAQDLILKATALAANHQTVHWHFVGPLQHNKYAKVLPIIGSLHSVDSVQCANRLKNFFDQKTRTAPLRVYIQINLSQQAHKHGLLAQQESDIRETISIIEACPALQWCGFMGMTSADVSDAARQQEFLALQQLRAWAAEVYQRSDLALSMGMSDDYAIALSCGADVIRIGSHLFS